MTNPLPLKSTPSSANCVSSAFGSVPRPGNHHFTNGISWPASQPNCFAVGAVKPGKDEVYLDRHKKVELVVPAAATSSSNAILCGAAMLLREAIEKSGYDWKPDGANLPEAMMAIFQKNREVGR